MRRRRKPSHPGKILDELYIKPLGLNIQKLADRLQISRNTLFKIRSGKATITTFVAIALSEAFDTTPQLWLNLQQKYDLWVEENEYEHEAVQPIIKNGKFLPVKHNVEIVLCTGKKGFKRRARQSQSSSSFAGHSQSAMAEK